MAEQEQTVDQQQEKAREKAEDDRYQRSSWRVAADRIAGIIIRSCFPGCILSCATWGRPCCWISWMHS